MRLFLFTFASILWLGIQAQQIKKIPISGILITSDSIPVPDVAIINARTGLSIRSNSAGFFQTEMNENDSLLLFHIAFKRRFIKSTQLREFIVLENEIQELMQIDISDKTKKEAKNLDNTVSDIKRIAPMKELSGYDVHSKQEYFIREHGSHNKAFVPFFGPTFIVPLSVIGNKISKKKERQRRKKLTSHYHLIRK